MRSGDFVVIVKVEGFIYREPGLPGDIARLWRPLIRDGRMGWVVKLDIDQTTFWVDSNIIRILPPQEQLVVGWNTLRGIWQPPRLNGPISPRHSRP